jgi:hypothetical protein
MNNEFKACILCNINKPLSEFHKNRNKDGRFNVCKKCAYIRNNHIRKDPTHKERFKAYRRSNALVNRYGITLEQYFSISNKQNGKCLICNTIPDPNAEHKQRSLNVDHCHKTGKIRGLLCHLCNRGIGLFKERIDLIEKALHYLKSHS